MAAWTKLTKPHMIIKGLQSLPQNLEEIYYMVHLRAVLLCEVSIDDSACIMYLAILLGHFDSAQAGCRAFLTQSSARRAERPLTWPTTTSGASMKLSRVSLSRLRPCLASSVGGLQGPLVSQPSLYAS